MRACTDDIVTFSPSCPSISTHSSNDTLPSLTVTQGVLPSAAENITMTRLPGPSVLRPTPLSAMRLPSKRSGLQMKGPCTRRISSSLAASCTASSMQAATLASGGASGGSWPGAASVVLNTYITIGTGFRSKLKRHYSCISGASFRRRACKRLFDHSTTVPV